MRPRLRTFDYVGRYRYFLTFCTHLREPLFTDANLVESVRTHLLLACHRCGFAISAYCFMRDHVHLLAEGQADNSDLREFVKLAKQTSGYAYAQATGGRMWQPSYHDHVLRDDETSLWVIAYILRNPVVTGLAERCSDYPFLGSLTMELHELLAMLREGLGEDWETRGLVSAAEWQA